MTHWHATANGDPRRGGTTVLVGTVHGSLRILARDRLGIDDPDGQRLMAVVVDRSEDRLMLAIADGTILRLTLLSELSLARARSSDSFCEQSWVVMPLARSEPGVPFVRPAREQDIAIPDQC